jgi:hypothetical protein
MRMMLKIVIPTETGNQAIKDGSLHKIFEATMSKLKPEAAYFVAEHGLRSATMSSVPIFRTTGRRPGRREILCVPHSAQNSLVTTSALSGRV